MMEVSLEIIERISSEVMASIRPGSDCEFNHDRTISQLCLLEKLITNSAASKSTSIGIDASEVGNRINSLRQSQHDIDASAVVEGVHIAQESRIGRLEHETMAKLVNKLRDKPQLAEICSTIASSITNLSEYSDKLSRESDIQRLAAAVLSQLIPSVRESFYIAPSLDDLPPLSDIDISKFQFD